MRVSGHRPWSVKIGRYGQFDVGGNRLVPLCHRCSVGLVKVDSLLIHVGILQPRNICKERSLSSKLDELAFRRSYRTPLLKRLGIRYRGPYNMRHSCATTMLRVGLNQEKLVSLSPYGLQFRQ